MIKPDMIEGVPEEEGYYWVNFGVPWDWQIVEIYDSVTGLRIRYATLPEEMVSGVLLENLNDNYTFSERIKEPEE